MNSRDCARAASLHYCDGKPMKYCIILSNDGPLFRGAGEGSMRLIPTILCGGAGSRLWPVSRELHPKPFIPLAPGQRPLQKALPRGAVLPRGDAGLTVTHRELFFKTQDEVRGVNARGGARAYG